MDNFYKILARLLTICLILFYPGTLLKALAVEINPQAVRIAYFDPYSCCKEISQGDRSGAATVYDNEIAFIDELKQFIKSSKTNNIENQINILHEKIAFFREQKTARLHNSSRMTQLENQINLLCKSVDILITERAMIFVSNDVKPQYLMRNATMALSTEYKSTDTHIWSKPINLKIAYVNVPEVKRHCFAKLEREYIATEYNLPNKKVIYPALDAISELRDIFLPQVYSEYQEEYIFFEQKAIRDAAKKLSRKHGYSLVIDISSVWYGKDFLTKVGTNITSLIEADINSTFKVPDHL